MNTTGSSAESMVYCMIHTQTDTQIRQTDGKNIAWVPDFCKLVERGVMDTNNSDAMQMHGSMHKAGMCAGFRYTETAKNIA